MTATLGHLSILLALALALYAGGAALWSARSGNPRVLDSARNAVLAQAALVTLAAAALIYAFVTTDFSIKFVALNTTRATPLHYRVSGLWSALEGSLLLWEWLLTLYASAVILLYRRRHPHLLPYVITIFMAVSAFFLFIMASPANPFERLSPVPQDGRGMNPLLEDQNMLTHPVLMYLGFVGFTVPYAFAMAALIRGQQGEEWLLTTRRWTIIAWYFLTAANLVGGWWSYHVLGWGGYWAWDPVENAAFMPWLPATAFLHSVMIQEKRRMLRVWNLILLILTFSLTLFGTFLTRSGILSSIHSFSTGPIGLYFLTFLGVVLLFSLSLLVWRADRLRGNATLDSLVSRESAFLLGNVVLIAALFSVFLGTLFPLLSEAVQGVKVSVGEPYFTRVFVPIALVLLFLMGVGPLLAWRRASLESVRRNFLAPASVGIVSALAIPLVGIRDFYPLLAFTLCLFVAAAVCAEFYRGVRARRQIAGENLLRGLTSLFQRNGRRYGGFIVHLGVVLIVIGITASSTYSLQKEVTLTRGEALEIGRYRIVLTGLEGGSFPTHFRVWGNFTVSTNGKFLAEMRPSKRIYPREQNPIARAVLRSTPREDLYLILTDFQPDGSAATLKVLVRPMVMWIWIGGGVMTLGTLLALLPPSLVRRRSSPEPHAVTA